MPEVYHTHPDYGFGHDFKDYGEQGLAYSWPNVTKIAVSFIINYKEVGFDVVIAAGNSTTLGRRIGRFIGLQGIANPLDFKPANLASTSAFGGEKNLQSCYQELWQEFKDHGILLPAHSSIPMRLILHVSPVSADDIFELMDNAEKCAGFSHHNNTCAFLFWCAARQYFRLEINEWAVSNDGTEVLAELRGALSLSKPASALVSILCAILGYFRLRDGMDTDSLADETDHTTGCEADSSLISDFDAFMAGRREDCGPLFEKVLPSLLVAMQQQLDTPLLNYFNDYLDDICIQSAQSDQEMEAYFCLRMQGLDHEEARITTYSDNYNWVVYSALGICKTATRLWRLLHPFAGVLVVTWLQLAVTWAAC